MRTLLLVAVLATAAHAQPQRVHRLTSAPLTITRPADFETAGETQIGDGVSTQIFSRLGTHSDAANTYVIVETHRRLSALKRSRFRRGIGIQRQIPSIAVERVDTDQLPIPGRLGETVGSAFVARHRDDSTGFVVRGCDGDVCYSIAVEGPGTDGLAHAPLLAGLALTD